MINNNKNQSGDINALINLVAQKMGKTPEELQVDLQSGSLPQSDKVRELLGDKAQLNSFLASPQVQQLLSELKKK